MQYADTGPPDRLQSPRGERRSRVEQLQVAIGRLDDTEFETLLDGLLTIVASGDGRPNLPTPA